MPVEQGFEVVALHRRAAVEALEDIAAFVAQRVELALRFDTFGDDFHRQAVRHGDHGAGYRQIVAAVRQVADEGAVDLEDVHRQFLEVGERGVAGAEIVNGEADTEGTQGFEQRDESKGPGSIPTPSNATPT